MGYYDVLGHPEVLAIWIVGPAAREVETVSDDAIVASKCLQLLKNCLGNQYEIPEPISVVRLVRFHNILVAHMLIVITCSCARID